MIKKYCKGLPLYVAAVAATLLAHGLAQYWDNQAEAQQPTTLARHI